MGMAYIEDQASNLIYCEGSSYHDKQASPPIGPSPPSLFPSPPPFPLLFALGVLWLWVTVSLFSLLWYPNCISFRLTLVGNW